MTSKVLGFVFAVLCGISTVPGQVVYYHHDPSTTIGNSNSLPFNTALGFSSVHFYSAQSLLDAGVAPGSVLQDFAVNTALGPGGIYSAPMARVIIGHLNGDTPIPNAWESNLTMKATVHETTSGPYTFPWAPISWVSLPGFASAAFVWDGINDIALFLSVSSGVTGGFNALTGTSGRFGRSNTFLATNETPTSTGFLCMKARMTFAGTPPKTHSSSATLTVNGSTSAAHLYGNDTLTLGATSNTALGQPLFLFFSTDFSGGHLPLAGQTFDLGDAAFGFSDVFILTAAGIVPFNTGPFLPFGNLDSVGSFSTALPLLCGTNLGRVFLQAGIVDPAFPPNGIRVTGISSFDVENSCRFTTASSIAIPIPDGGAPVTASITAPTGTLINDLDLLIQVNHNQISDLIITLDLNSLVVVQVLGPGPVDTSNLSGLYQISDEGALSLPAVALLSGTAILGGRFAGSNPLSAFDTLDVGGTWTLTVTDTVAGNTGTLDGFSLLVNGAE